MKRSVLVALAMVLLLALSPPLRLGAAENQLSPPEKAAGWRLLFDGSTLSGWRSFKKPTGPAKGWVAEDGWLHGLGKGGGDIVTDAQFDNFELQWEWRLRTNGNSGVKYFVLESRSSALGHEYQMIDDRPGAKANISNPRQNTGSFYDVLKPFQINSKPPGEINQSRIVVDGRHVEHWLNGQKVLDYDCGGDDVKKAVAASKFRNVPGFGEKVKGHLLLQDHASEVWFRNLKIRELPAKPATGS